jgi:hypothetical protein
MFQDEEQAIEMTENMRRGKKEKRKRYMATPYLSRGSFLLFPAGPREHHSLTAGSEREAPLP